MPTTRYTDVRFRLMDLCWLGYLAAVALLLLTLGHGRVRHWPLMAAAHLCLIVAGLEIVRAQQRRPELGALWILRALYPLPLALYTWTELGSLLPFPSHSFWATDAIIRLDLLLFRVHPSVWADQHRHLWLDETMSFFYVSYFVLYVGTPLFFLRRAKREETLAVLSAVSFVCVLHYAFFLLVPTVSPLHSEALGSLHTHPVTGYWLSALMRSMEGEGAVRGAAFPSNHVSMAVCWVLAAGRYRPRLARWLAPIPLGVALATVYLGQHHALDPLFGAVWGWAGCRAATAILRRRGEDPLLSR